MPAGVTTLIGFKRVAAGLSFEQRILTQQQNNSKFNFLRPNDPYHAYYRYKASLRLPAISHRQFCSRTHPPAVHAIHSFLSQAIPGGGSCLIPDIISLCWRTGE